MDLARIKGSISRMGVVACALVGISGAVYGDGSDLDGAAAFEEAEATQAELGASTSFQLFKLKLTIKNPTPAPYERFGGPIVPYAGNILISGLNTEAVYHYNSSTGARIRTFKNPGAAYDCFGFALATLRDKIIVGAPCVTQNDLSNVGRAYIFDGKTGALLRTLRMPDDIDFAQFGIAVAAVGPNVLVGADQVSTAYLFNADTGALIRRIVNPVAAHEGGAFGSAMASVGSHAVVAAYGATVAGVGGAGAAYLLNANGGLVKTFVAPDGSGLGWKIAARGTYGDDLRVLAGSDGPNKAWFFNGTTGALIRTLVNPEAVPGDVFGSAVGFVGRAPIVGAVWANGTGMAYLFDPWKGNLLQKFKAPTPTTMFYGDALSGAGAKIIVGAPGTLVNNVEFAGAAYVYTIPFLE